MNDPLVIVANEAGAAEVGASAPAPPASSLDNIDHSGTNRGKTKVEWSKAQKRCFQRVRSLFTYWSTHDYQLLWVMLSTAPGGDRSKLAYHHKRIRQQLERKLGYKGVQMFQVETSEGHGVLHIVWAWHGDQTFYVPQDWLSAEWERIHGAKIVWVSRIGGSKKDRDKVGRYMIAQYCGSQSGFVRFSWSWWSMDVAVSKNWESLKRLASVSFYDETARWHWRREYILPMSEVITAWESLLTDGETMLGETLIELRGRLVVEVF